MWLPTRTHSYTRVSGQCLICPWSANVLEKVRDKKSRPSSASNSLCVTLLTCKLDQVPCGLSEGGAVSPSHAPFPSPCLLLSLSSSYKVGWHMCMVINRTDMVSLLTELIAKEEHEEWAVTEGVICALQRTYLLWLPRLGDGLILILLFLVLNKRPNT